MIGNRDNISSTRVYTKPVTPREQLIEVMELAHFLSDEHKYIYDYQIDEMLYMVKEVLLGNINATTPFNHETLLFIAAKKGYIDVVTALVFAGADVTIATSDGTTPRKIAHLQAHYHIVELIDAHLEMNGIKEIRPHISVVGSKLFGARVRLAPQRAASALDPYAAGTEPHLVAIEWAAPTTSSVSVSASLSESSASAALAAAPAAPASTSSASSSFAAAADALTVSAAPHSFFMPPKTEAQETLSLPMLDDHIRTQLLTKVLKSDYTFVENIIQHNSQILLEKIFLIPSGECLTLLQYALWSYDNKLSHLVLNYMSCKDAVDQLSRMSKDENSSIKRFDFSAAVKSYQALFGYYDEVYVLSGYSEFFGQQLIELSVQLNNELDALPSHILNEYPQLDPTSQVNLMRMASIDLSNDSDVDVAINMARQDCKLLERIILQGLIEAGKVESRILNDSLVESSSYYSPRNR